jgi:hypothetical protein
LAAPKAAIPPAAKEVARATAHTEAAANTTAAAITEAAVTTEAADNMAAATEATIKETDLLRSTVRATSSAAWPALPSAATTASP